LGQKQTLKRPSPDVRFAPKSGHGSAPLRASQTAKPPIDQAEVATALSVSGDFVTLRSDRVTYGRIKEPPPYL
jgi:hypothetical protein